MRSTFSSSDRYYFDHYFHEVMCDVEQCMLDVEKQTIVTPKNAHRTLQIFELARTALDAAELLCTSGLCIRTSYKLDNVIKPVSKELNRRTSLFKLMFAELLKFEVSFEQLAIKAISAKTEAEKKEIAEEAAPDLIIKLVQQISEIANVHEDKSKIEEAVTLSVQANIALKEKKEDLAVSLAFQALDLSRCVELPYLVYIKRILDKTKDEDTLADADKIEKYNYSIACCIRGFFYYRKKNYVKAREFFLLSMNSIDDATRFFDEIQKILMSCFYKCEYAHIVAPVEGSFKMHEQADSIVMARNAMKNNNWKEAIEYLDKAIQNQCISTLLGEYALVHFFNNEPKKAIEYFSVAIWHSKVDLVNGYILCDLIKHLWMRGRVFFAMGEFENGEKDFAEMLSQLAICKQKKLSSDDKDEGLNLEAVLLSPIKKRDFTMAKDMLSKILSGEYFIQLTKPSHFDQMIEACQQLFANEREFYKSKQDEKKSIVSEPMQTPVKKPKQKRVREFATQGVSEDIYLRLDEVKKEMTSKQIIPKVQKKESKTSPLPHKKIRRAGKKKTRRQKKLPVENVVQSVPVKIEESLPQVSSNFDFIPKKIVKPIEVVPLKKYQTDFKIILPKELADHLINLKKQHPLSFVCGGLVRDALLKVEAKGTIDVDFVTGASKAEIERAFPSAGFSVSQDPKDQRKFSVTPLGIGPKPFQIQVFHSCYLADAKSVDPVREDAKHRCYRLNTFIADEEGTVFAPIKEAITDLQNRELVVVDVDDSEHKRDIVVAKSFKADPLRMLRGLYHANKLSLKLETAVLPAIKVLHAALLGADVEGVNRHIKKLLAPPYAVENFKVLIELNIIPILFPLLQPFIPQDKPIDGRLMQILSSLRKPSLEWLYVGFVLLKIKSEKAANLTPEEEQEVYVQMRDKLVKENRFIAARFMKKDLDALFKNLSALIPLNEPVKPAIPPAQFYNKGRVPLLFHKSMLRGYSQASVQYGILSRKLR